MPDFDNAARDYRFLRNRGYPERGALKLVGDRYRLTAGERNCLFRGVIPDRLSAPRREKLVRPEDLRRTSLGVDWFNVLITVESYLKGLPVFVSDDGVLRDSSGVHGSYRPGRVTGPARERLLEAVRELAPERVELFLDSPVSFSGRMAEELREEAERRLAIPCDIRVVPSADFPLKSFPGVVASSDSVVMDAARWIFDLPRHVLARSFGSHPLALPGAPPGLKPAHPPNGEVPRPCGWPGSS